jgi:putative tricarboxylic transport membrane protein
MNERHGARALARDIAAGLVLLGLAVTVWLAAEAIPKSPLGGQIGADGFPKLLAGSLGVLAVLLIGQTLLARRGSAVRAASARPVEPSASPREPMETASAGRHHMRAAGMLAIGVLYVALLETLGFVLSTLLLLLAVALYNGRRPTLGLAAVAVIGAALLYVLFVRLLGVPLPPGIWPGLVS